MVTITNFHTRQRKDGTSFVALEITGGVELIQSQNSGRYYATVRKCSIPSTFDEQIAKAMIGQQLEGDVVKLIVEPYDYTNPKTGEIIRLQHSYGYRAKDAQEVIGHTPVREFLQAIQPRQ